MPFSGKWLIARAETSRIARKVGAFRGFAQSLRERIFGSGSSGLK